MSESAEGRRTTTHDWSASLDRRHSAQIRAGATRFAPTGVVHLVYEVLAYAADEAAATGGGDCTVTLHPDGSMSVADRGRGTDTRFDDHRRPVRKPIMATKDLRFFDHPAAQTLPDGLARRGMSVVAALSDWLLHINRRLDGAWQQRYEHGLPVTDLTVLAPDGTTGTTVCFRPGSDLRQLAGSDLAGLSCVRWPNLDIVLVDLRG